MGCAKHGQNSSNTKESDTGISSEVELELPTEIEGENHDLGILNLFLSITVSSSKYTSVGIFRGSL